MRKLALLAGALVALAVASPAQADLYNGNNLSNGQNVCAMDVGIFQGGGSFNSYVTLHAGGSACSFTVGNQFYSFDAPCRATVYRTTPAASDAEPASGLGDCPRWAAVGESYSHFGGTARFRLDLSGFSLTWDAPGCVAGFECVKSGSLGSMSYDCTIGANRKVKDCTFRRDV